MIQRLAEILGFVDSDRPPTRGEQAAVYIAAIVVIFLALWWIT